MANDAIVGKLARYSRAPLEDEASVVYLMVQIGKIIERQVASADFPAIWFYRNWVVHHKLDRQGNDGRGEMLDKLNAAALATIEKRHNYVLELFETAISLKKLHREIADFFNSTLLARPPEEVDYVEWFKRFDTLLINVLVDLPLVPPTKGDYVFNEFRFKESTTGISDPEFEMQVLESANNGRPLTIKGRLRVEVEDLKWMA